MKIIILLLFTVFTYSQTISNDTLKLDVKLGAVVWIKSETKDYYRFTIRNKKEQEEACIGWNLKELDLPKGTYIIEIKRNNKTIKILNYERTKTQKK